MAKRKSTIKVPSPNKALKKGKNKSLVPTPRVQKASVNFPLSRKLITNPPPKLIGWRYSN